MRTKGLRGALAADPQLGAGNVLARVLAHGADPQGPGLTFDTPVDGHPAGQPLTLGQLDERVAARAAWLHDRGVRPRDPVAVWATAAADMVLSFLALARLGAIPALMNGKLRPEIAAEYIRRLRGAGVLADAAHIELLAGHDLGAPLLGTPQEAGSGDPAQAPADYRHHPDDPIVITHTSGTTGVPKAVLHSHASLFAATRHLLSMPQAQGTRRILNALPAPHTATGSWSTRRWATRRRCPACPSRGASGSSTPSSVAARRGLRLLDDLGRAGPLRPERVRPGLGAAVVQHRRLLARAPRTPARRGRPRDVFTRQGVTRSPVRSSSTAWAPARWALDVPHHAHRRHRPVRPLRGPPLPVRRGWPSSTPRARSCPPVRSASSASTRRRCPGATGTTRSPATGSGSRGWYLTGDLVYGDADGRYYHVDRAVDSVALRRRAAGTSPPCPRSGSSPAAPTSRLHGADRSPRRHGHHRRAAGAGRRGRPGRRPDRDHPGRARGGRRGDPAPGGAGERRRHPVLLSPARSARWRCAKRYLRRSRRHDRRDHRDGPVQPRRAGGGGHLRRV